MRTQLGSTGSGAPARAATPCLRVPVLWYRTGPRQRHRVPALSRALRGRVPVRECGELRGRLLGHSGGQEPEFREGRKRGGISLRCHRRLPRPRHSRGSPSDDYRTSPHSSDFLHGQCAQSVVFRRGSVGRRRGRSVAVGKRRQGNAHRTHDNTTVQRQRGLDLPGGRGRQSALQDRPLHSRGRAPCPEVAPRRRAKRLQSAKPERKRTCGGAGRADAFRGSGGRLPSRYH